MMVKNKAHCGLFLIGLMLSISCQISFSQENSSSEIGDNVNSEVGTVESSGEMESMSQVDRNSKLGAGDSPSNNASGANAGEDLLEDVSSSNGNRGTSFKNNSSDSKNAGNDRVIYEYKKEDYFNFEALNVKGELLSPGDLSSKATKRAKYSPSKYIRNNFDDYIVNDLLEVY